MGRRPLHAAELGAANSGPGDLRVSGRAFGRQGTTCMIVEAGILACRQADKPQPAPAAEQFAEWPASWYLFCSSGDLRRGPMSKRILGRDLVAYRTQSGKLALLEASCAHMGADLGNGTVAGECIRCPFH